MSNTLVSQKLHANVSLNLLSILGTAHAEKTLLIFLPFIIGVLFLDLVQIVLDDHCLKNRMCIFMLGIK